MAIKTCKVCGNRFDAVGSHKTCGNDCSDALKASRLDSVARIRSPPKMRDCVICGMSFRIFSGTVRTCSKRCSNSLALKTQRKRHRRLDGVKKCVVCGDEFKVYGSQVTCTKKCSAVRKRTYVPVRNKDKANATRRKWLAIPGNRERVRASQIRSEKRRLDRMSSDEIYAKEHMAKIAAVAASIASRIRNAKIKADSKLLAERNRKAREYQKKTRQEMTPDELAAARKIDRDEMRRLMADPVRSEKYKEWKRQYRRRRHEENAAMKIMNALSVLSEKLKQEIKT